VRVLQVPYSLEQGRPVDHEVPNRVRLLPNAEVVGGTQDVQLHAHDHEAHPRERYQGLEVPVDSDQVRSLRMGLLRRQLQRRSGCHLPQPPGARRRS